MPTTEVPTVYLTKEQIVRLAGLSCDALIGIQIHTDASDVSPVTCEFVDVDDTNLLRHFWVAADGDIEETT